MSESKQLLRDYIANGSESAFRQIVQQYVDLVYSTALRRTDYDTRFAEDITQTVFIDLAAKASSLGAEVMLGGWLHKHTCLVASNVLRAEKRRLAREQQAMEADMLKGSEEESWREISPILDEVIQELAPSEREIIVLRFFEKRDFRSVGAVLGLSDDAAQKRVSRALERLRVLLGQRGVTMGIAGLGAALADRSIQAAPAELTSAIVEVTANRGPVLRAGRGARPNVFMIAGAVAVLLVVCLHPNVSSAIRTLFGAGASGRTAVSYSRSATNTPGSATVLAGEANDASGKDVAVTADSTVEQSTKVLRLIVVAADTGKPIPNVPIEVESWDDVDWKRMMLMGDRAGHCQVRLPSNLKSVDIFTRVEGFADRRLSLNVERGQVIPSHYILRLVRPVRISGRVLDPEGKPIADAKVSFGHEESPWLQEISVESSRFQWISVKTDSDGRWQLNRIAPEMIKMLSCSASHQAYVDSPSLDLSDNPEAEKQLLNGTHIFRLGKTLSIRGTVQDAEGNPVPNADVLFGQRGMSSSREARTGPDGMFQIANAQPGKELLTAQAEGFAASTIRVEVTPNSTNFNLRLRRGHTIRMRVVDVQGQPVRRAHIVYAHDQGRRDSSLVVQAAFEALTDGFGRAVWNDAPKEEVLFHCFALGYMTGNEIKLRAGEQEHVITLRPALSISGTVQDAATGKDIPKFRMICGWPDENGPQWSPLSRFWVFFEGGKFKHSLEEPIIHGMENPGYIFKFEAEGYEPFVSRVVAPTERNVEIPVKLKPAETRVITVLSGDGGPVAFAEVGLVLPGADLQIEDGRFAPGNYGNPAARIRADAEGKFRLPADPSITHVAVLHPTLGCALVSSAELASSPYIHLQPWGRLEATLHIQGKPAVQREFITKLPVTETEAITYSFDKRRKSDNNGKVLFPKLPPGLQRVTTFLEYTNDNSVSFQHVDLKEVFIQPGQTTVVDLSEDDNQNPAAGELTAD